MRLLLSASSLALLLASAAAAQNPGQSVPPPVPKKDNGSKMICKTEEFVGSRIPRRICMTQSQWDQGRADAHEIMDQRRMWKDVTTKGGG